MTEKLAQYKNGNTIVVILKDGTKIRHTPDGQKPEPEFPESIDLKITNKCDMGCAFCHEQSSPEGLHADLRSPLLESLPAGTELAIGGGNPLEHPGLEDLLERMKEQAVICNMTVNIVHFERHHDQIKRWFEKGLIHGLGVSVGQELLTPGRIALIQKFPTAVVHTIVGIFGAFDNMMLSDKNLNLLILGYKQYGRGVTYEHEPYSRVNENTNWLKTKLPELKEHFRSVCFDNLALKQLDVKNTLFCRRPEDWKTFYMGDDGSFTMYVDLVKKEFAKSSVSPRQSMLSNNIRDLFKAVREHG